jgi:hypothetical protein
MDFKYQKSPDFCQMFVISKKKAIPKGHGYKNLLKIYTLAYGFLFFVISISAVCSSGTKRPYLQASRCPQPGRKT